MAEQSTSVPRMKRVAIGSFGLSPGSGKLKLFRLSIEGQLVAAAAPPPASDIQGAIDAAVERGISYLLREGRNS